MATYTVLFDAVNYMRRSELADRPEHVTARRGETIELEGAEAERLVASGGIVEGEVDPAAYEAEQRAAEEQAAREAAGDDADAPAPVPGAVMPEADLNTGATTVEEADADAEAEAEAETSTRRRR